MPGGPATEHWPVDGQLVSHLRVRVSHLLFAVVPPYKRLEHVFDFDEARWAVGVELVSNAPTTRRLQLLAVEDMVVTALVLVVHSGDWWACGMIVEHTEIDQACGSAVGIRDISVTRREADGDKLGENGMEIWVATALGLEPVVLVLQDPRAVVVLCLEFDVRAKLRKRLELEIVAPCIHLLDALRQRHCTELRK